MATYWTNDDGLTVRFGTRETEVNKGAQASTAGVVQQIVVDVDATKIGSSASDNLSVSAFVPAGSLVRSAELIVDEAFVGGGTSTLDVGTYDADGTAIDADGLLAGVAEASLTADTLVVGAGAQVGAVVNSDAYVSMTFGAAAFTAGSGKLVVEYIKQ